MDGSSSLSVSVTVTGVVELKLALVTVPGVTIIVSSASSERSSTPQI